MAVIDKMLPLQSVIDDWLQTRTFFTNSLAHTYKFIACKLHTLRSYQSLKENCVNAAELLFNTLWNFVCLLVIYRLCSRIFFSGTKLLKKIALSSSELSLNMPWNFMRTFKRTSSKIHGNKERNSHISLALLLHNTVNEYSR